MSLPKCPKGHPASVLMCLNDVWRFDCGHSRSDYEIELYRLDSAAKALGWLVHLRQKNWFDGVCEQSFLLRLADLGLVEHGA